MSHSSHETARALRASVRDVGAKHRHPIGILCDLQGPKFRFGEFHGGRVFVNDGAIFRFDRNDDAGIGRARVPAASADLRGRQSPGDTLLIDDGKRAHARHRETAERAIAAEVVAGGALSSRKGMSLPDTVLPIGPLTDKDRADLDCAPCRSAPIGSRCRSCSAPTTLSRPRG